MRDDIYTEGIGEMNFNLGMVRMNLVGLSDEKDEQGNLKPETQQRMVMSLRGFLVSLAAMQDMADKLVEAGVLKRKEGEGVKPA
ncbi:hypothetical protein [Magnetofaba australis]|uniref:Uncharacterized protein n=1 Tax=Magnetofaba australis IT-1 TaxID=1434232 RepID=A0A1Y2K4G0_9PROT|nr:hypothetical protein [Magnetofaba australis]OSM04109.1 hypothetical protein MAIT1_03625 [Magnetofaba australis IT-1]